MSYVMAVQETARPVDRCQEFYVLALDICLVSIVFAGLVWLRSP
jgi:hypothetical protein